MDEKVFFEKLADAFQVDEGDVNNTFELNSENLDSIVVLDIIAAIDEQFGVTVPAEKLKQCTSVGAILELIHSQNTPL